MSVLAAVPNFTASPAAPLAAPDPAAPPEMLPALISIPPFRNTPAPPSPPLVVPVPPAPPAILPVLVSVPVKRLTPAPPTPPAPALPLPPFPPLMLPPLVTELPSLKFTPTPPPLPALLLLPAPPWIEPAFVRVLPERLLNTPVAPAAVGATRPALLTVSGLPWAVLPSVTVLVIIDEIAAPTTNVISVPPLPSL